jgi:predicted O-methyltransferase YrrM
MREFVSISFAQFSRAFWERVEYRAKEFAESSNLQRRFLELGGGPYCIDVKTGYWLFCLAHFYQPKTVCEIGTYRGRSASALAAGMGTGTLWTCDKENDWLVESPSDVEIRQHRKMTSTAMLAEMKEPIDLFFFDGRIQVQDEPHIARLSHKHTVYVLDDFEGLEKGVHNAFKLVDETKIAHQ